MSTRTTPENLKIGARGARGWGGITNARPASGCSSADLAKIEAAKRDGSWESLDRVEALEVPPDLGKALDASREATRNFAAFNNSTRKQIPQWIESARRPETRARRIAQTAERAARGERPPVIS